MVWYNSLLSSPSSKALFTIATSVGSPVTCIFPCSPLISTSVHILASPIIHFAKPASWISPLIPANFTTCILFCVKVPVLSEQIMLLLPKVSTAGNFRIILFFRAIFVTPIDNIIVTIAGNPSGMAATASPTEVINISIGAIFFIIPMTKIRKQMTKQTAPKLLPTCDNFFCKGVSGASLVKIICAIFPTFVFIPISVIIASPCPFTTIVVENAIFFKSPKFVFSFNNCSASFSTGTVSPVKLDSSIFKLVEEMSLQSAGT